MLYALYRLHAARMRKFISLQIIPKLISDLILTLKSSGLI